jgi:hypothetical protein
VNIEEQIYTYVSEASITQSNAFDKSGLEQISIITNFYYNKFLLEQISVRTNFC